MELVVNGKGVMMTSEFQAHFIAYHYQTESASHCLCHQIYVQQELRWLCSGNSDSKHSQHNPAKTEDSRCKGEEDTCL